MTSIGNGKAPSRGTSLVEFGDDDHALRGGGDDLLPQQRAAAALDQIELGIDFVGPVDGQIEFRNVVESSERNAERLRLRFCRLRSPDAADIETRFDPLAHEIDELARGRAAAEPELHARSDQLKRPFAASRFRWSLSDIAAMRLTAFVRFNAALRFPAHSRGTSGKSRFTGWRERRQIPLR